MTKYYWVYLPDVDEAGTVVQAASFEAAFEQGCATLFPDDGAEVQVHELGESQSFVAEVAEGYRADRTDLCEECKWEDHQTCSLSDATCPCCRDTAEQMEAQG